MTRPQHLLVLRVCASETSSLNNDLHHLLDKEAGRFHDGWFLTNVVMWVHEQQVDEVRCVAQCHWPWQLAMHLKACV